MTQHHCRTTDEHDRNHITSRLQQLAVELDQNNMAGQAATVTQAVIELRRLQTVIDSCQHVNETGHTAVSAITITAADGTVHTLGNTQTDM